MVCPGWSSQRRIRADAVSGAVLFFFHIIEILLGFGRVPALLRQNVASILGSLATGGQRHSIRHSLRRSGRDIKRLKLRNCSWEDATMHAGERRGRVSSSSKRGSSGFVSLERIKTSSSNSHAFDDEIFCSQKPKTMRAKKQKKN